jgi:hypothetical protein
MNLLVGRGMGLNADLVDAIDDFINSRSALAIHSDYSTCRRIGGKVQGLDYRRSRSRQFIKESLKFRGYLWRDNDFHTDLRLRRADFWSLADWCHVRYR